MRLLAPLLLLLHLSAVLYWIATGYLAADLTGLAGLMLLPLVTLVRPEGRPKLLPMTALLALSAVAFTLLVPARTFYFLALGFSALFILEKWRGRQNALPLFFLFLLSSVVKTLNTILGFEMRLQLSDWAAYALRSAGWEAVAEGNVIRFQGRPFSVDPACLGLSMVEVSFLFCFLLLALFERKMQRRLPAWLLALSLLATVALNIGFNFLRILLIIVFNILPGTLGHEVVGLAGLALYVFLPLYFGLRWGYKRIGKPVVSRFLWENSPSEKPGLRLYPMLPVCSVLAISILSSMVFFSRNTDDQGGLVKATAIVPAGLPSGCMAENLPGGIVKYASDSLLIYVKPIRGFYDTEHTPLLCWRGSGYRFGQVWEARQGACFMGRLEKGGDGLVTAWWFGNGRERTVNQARWRWLDLSGAPGFSLINVTAKDPAVLARQLERMLVSPAENFHDLSHLQ